MTINVKCIFGRWWILFKPLAPLLLSLRIVRLGKGNAYYVQRTCYVSCSSPYRICGWWSYYLFYGYEVSKSFTEWSKLRNWSIERALYPSSCRLQHNLIEEYGIRNKWESGITYNHSRGTTNLHQPLRQHGFSFQSNDIFRKRAKCTMTRLLSLDMTSKGL